MGRVRWIRPDDEAVDAAMQIYSTSFPPNETRPAEETITLARSETYRLYVIEGDGGVAGMALVYVWKEFALLDYMAVEKTRRGRGIGSLLFRELAKQMADRVLLLEIEDPASGRQAARRERFYKSLGAATISDTYVMPSYEGMEPEVMPLMGVSTSGSPFECTMDWVRMAVRQIYADVYDRKREDFVSDSLIGMPDTVKLKPVQ